MKRLPQIARLPLAAAALASTLTLGAVFESDPAAKTDGATTMAPAPSGGAEVFFRRLDIQGVDVAYREAGDPSRPTVLLLHGFPTSSHMFLNLIPVLGERFHVLAPDYPGFGASAMPDR